MHEISFFHVSFLLFCLSLKYFKLGFQIVLLAGLFQMVLLAGRKDFKTRLLLTWEIYAGWSTPLFDPISRWCSRLEILQWKSWDALIRFSLCGHYDLPATRKKKKSYFWQKWRKQAKEGKLCKSSVILSLKGLRSLYLCVFWCQLVTDAWKFPVNEDWGKVV